MNKTTNINLAGLFFHIDENAYSKLKHYLDAISHSLNDDPQGKEEIIKDIEQRISELFSAKISKERQVINEKDVDDVISIMGQPEDYQYDNELFEDKKSEKNYESKTTRSKKLYRSGKDSILGGVASGLAHYVGMDVTWMRIIWIILLFPGGLSLWVYPILWLIVPEAKTTAEELEMKGEPVTIDNIERKVKEEYSRIESKIKNADYEPIKNGFQQLLDTLGQIIQTIFKVFGKFIGVVILIVASAVLVGLIISLFSWGTFEMVGKNSHFINYPEFFEISYLPKWLLVLAMLFAIMIPFIYLFMLGLNVLSKDKKSLGTTGNLSLLGVWLLSVFALVFAGIEYGVKFSEENFSTDIKMYNLKEKDTLFIKMSNNDIIANRKNLYRSDNLEKVLDENKQEKLYSSYVHLDIRRSNDKQIMVKVIKTARGFNEDKAIKKAESIEYLYKLEDNTLDLNSYFLTDLGMKFNFPKIDVIVYIPENKAVYLDSTTSSFLYDVHNVQSIYDYEMANHYFIMDKTGFNCTDCIKDNENSDVDINVDTKGVNINIDNGKEKAKVKIDENGIEVK